MIVSLRNEFGESLLKAADPSLRSGWHCVGFNQGEKKRRFDEDFANGRSWISNRLFFSPLWSQNALSSWAERRISSCCSIL